MFSSISKDINIEKLNFLPENTIGEKITKVRKLHNMDINIFCRELKIEIKDLYHWEHDLVMPSAKSIKKICDYFKIEPSYFDEYYSWYYSNYEEAFLKWKKDNNYSYSKCAMILGLHKGSLVKFVHRKYSPSYNFYLLLKDNNLT